VFTCIRLVFTWFGLIISEPLPLSLSHQKQNVKAGNIFLKAVCLDSKTEKEVRARF
jgi:hypothetical protein